MTASPPYGQWINSLSADPLPSLLEWGDPALSYFVQRDLLGNEVAPVETLWEIDAAARLVKMQRPGGGWLYPSKSFDPESGTWSPAHSLSDPRYGHTATRLASGMILVAGGYGAGSLSSCELFDPLQDYILVCSIKMYLIH